MFSLASHSLSRTSSVSSVASDDSLASSGVNTSTSADTPADNILKRTRKRFTSVWFQNKRQTDRRVHRQVPEALSGSQPSPSSSLSHSQSPTSLLPPSSPFSDASGNTIHTVRARTRTLSGDSSTSALSAMGRKREREHEGDAQHPPTRHIRHKPSRHLSLDDVAARAERPALLPRTLPQAVVVSESPSSSSPVRPVTLDLKRALSVVTAAGVENEGQGMGPALWENMPSSPVAPDDPVPSRSERDIVRYGGGRRITLEYACAREMVGGKEWVLNWCHGRDGEKDRARMRSGGGRKDRGKSKSTSRHRHHPGARRKSVAMDDVQVSGDGQRLGHAYTHTHTQAKEQDEEGPEEDIPIVDYGGGDTDTEGAPSEPPVTPSSSFDLGELHAMEEDEADEDSDRTVTVPREVLVGARGKNDEPMAVKVHVAQIQSGPDDDLMDVAYVLCGLSQRR
ncbi:hypothetical protein LXA43DRAFT_1013874 [Ganoderma leucocontextum]|nr:hypothetical protein LXA43DRAFT_1013874 [Ganoderma leucocontextum]